MSQRRRTGFLSVVVIAAAMLMSTVVAAADTGDAAALPEVLPLLIENDFRRQEPVPGRLGRRAQRCGTG